MKRVVGLVINLWEELVKEYWTAIRCNTVIDAIIINSRNWELKNNNFF